MGVPYYFYQLYKKYNDESQLMINEHAIQNLKVNHLFFDYNSMVHPCAHEALGSITDSDLSVEDLDKLVIDNCIRYTRYILTLLNPKTVHIMIDGVAPRAKINQQRERRYKSAFVKKLDQTSPVWDSNKITPGTKFMSCLKNALEQLKEELGNIYCINISDSDVCGEGEHKMMSVISELQSDGKICIYGLDADLIMLSLLNSQSDKLVLLRDNTFNERARESERKFTYLDVKNLKGAICEEFRGYIYNFSCHKQLSCCDEQLINDYIVLCFLLGNDFLEHLPNLRIKDNALSVLMKCYATCLQRTFVPLVNMSKVSSTEWMHCLNLEFLSSIISSVGKSEDYYFRKIFNANVLYKDKLDIENIPIESGLLFLTKDFINFKEPGYKKRYYEYHDIQDVEKCCIDYITGIYWVFGYYKNHIHGNWSWYYAHNAVPFASDIASVFGKPESHASAKYQISNLIRGSPNTTTQQLMMVLPKQSLLTEMQFVNKQVYERVKRFLRTDSSIDIERSYPNKITLDITFCEYIWQSKVLFEEIDIDSFS